jgi:hypothetical protein
MDCTTTASDFAPLRPTGPATRRPREIRDKARKPKSNPRSTWPSWTDGWDVTITEDGDEPRPTAGPDYTPARLDDVEWSGMTLALSGEPMAEIETEDTSIALRFAVGQYRGLVARHDAEREARGHDAWIDQQYLEAMMARSSDEPREADQFSPGYYS